MKAARLRLARTKKRNKSQKWSYPTSSYVIDRLAEATTIHTIQHSIGPESGTRPSDEQPTSTLHDTTDIPIGARIRNPI
jgi:hypothetical protein